MATTTKTTRQVKRVTRDGITTTTETTTTATTETPDTAPEVQPGARHAAPAVWFYILAAVAGIIAAPIIGKMTRPTLPTLPAYTVAK
jgi:hypothetical protein